MIYERKNQGTCSVLTRVDLADDHTIRKVEVMGGCNGNLKGICQLLAGMKAEDAIQRMKGTTCGPRPTSCPDQISRALEEALTHLG
ncbi:TIGR03905 family TSCPD domain-containing protein [Gemmiger formicilis]|uniref:TIGR03905 family TSCPD domain-containing protein n=1 Tax=Gemmiger formicilis TaxID=745368 RepID=UPI00195ABF2C|nr:TIGR03905 family TSCPD domain-containing protein [Gemmiger formicilis]MBM6715492.1 TIGR03905 family TSCPD domain-containing protein [Gemmiger formicilis]